MHGEGGVIRSAALCVDSQYGKVLLPCVISLTLNCAAIFGGIPYLSGIAMDVRQLTYFVAVAETGNMGRAAKRLHMSQPPLSRQIHALEVGLQVQLFERSPRGMALTDAGRELLRHARSLLSGMERAAEQTLRVARGNQGRIDVGVYGSAMFGLVPRILTAFRQDHPEVDVVLHHAQTPQQIDALRQGRVLLVFERLLPDEIDVQVLHVAREQMLIAMAEDHPLAERDSVSLRDLADQNLIVGSSPSDAASAIELCRTQGFEPRFAAAAPDVVTAALLAATGVGVTLVPQSMRHVQFPRITYRAIESPRPAFMDFYCFHLRGSTSPLLAAMLGTLKSLQGELLPSPAQVTATASH